MLFRYFIVIVNILPLELRVEKNDEKVVKTENFLIWVSECCYIIIILVYKMKKDKKKLSVCKQYTIVILLLTRTLGMLVKWAQSKYTTT